MLTVSLVGARRPHRTHLLPLFCKRSLLMQNLAIGRIGWLRICGIIFMTCFTVYFLHCNEFGTYSDDQSFVALYSMKGFRWFLSSLSSLGRPLGNLAMYTTLFPLFAVGGLPLAYLGACIVLSIETLLVFCFFRQFIADLPSLTLALIYLLFPPDVSKFLFVAGLYSHVSGIMFWASSIFYVRRMPVTAALTVVASMLVWEIHLIQALTIPLICYTLGQFALARADRWREELLPGAKFLAVFALAGVTLLIGRFVLAPGRLPSKLPGSAVETLERFLHAGFSGVKAVLRSHADRFTSLVSDNRLGIYLVLCGVLTIIYLLCSQWVNHSLASEKTSTIQDRLSRKWACVLIFFGFALMFVSYLPFALEPERFPPNPITTRMSSVHYGAPIGYVILWAGLYGVLTTWGRAGRFGFLFAFILYFTVTGGFFIRHQEQLAQNWQTQTIYWAEMEQCLRTTNPKLIIVDDTDEEIRGGQAELLFDWTTPYVPYLVEHSLKPAAEWPLVQSLTALKGLSKVKVVGDYAELSSMTTWGIFPTEQRIKLSDIMLVKPFKGALIRPSGSLEIGGTRILAGDRCYIHTTVSGQ